MTGTPGNANDRNRPTTTRASLNRRNTHDSPGKRSSCGAPEADTDTTSYTLTIANAVDIRLTDRQARDLYQQFHEEFAPKARFT